MAEATGISWADATFNPWVGCEKVSPGCARCYAEVLVTGRMGRAGTWGADGTRERTSESNWKKPLRWDALARDGLLPNGRENPDGHRPRIFCASLADAFEPRPELDPWRRDLFALIEQTPALDWMLLTKRPEEARDWLRAWWVEHRPLRMEHEGTLWTHAPSEREWHERDDLGWGVLPNVWIGASVENARFTWRADALREIPATVRFLSCEPLVGSLFPTNDPQHPGTGSTRLDRVGLQGSPEAGSGGARGRTPLDLTGIDWVIVGGESGGRDSRPMHPQWAREIRDAVQQAAQCPQCGGLGWDVETRAGCCGSYLPTGECCGVAVPVQEQVECGCWQGELRRSNGDPQVVFHFKQWGAYVEDQWGRDPDAVWVAPDGRVETRLSMDALGLGTEMNGAVRMRYAGGGPDAGGHVLDGREWREMPTPTGAAHAA